MNSLQDFQTSNKLDHDLILSSLPPTPSKSTAFTIEFDDLNNNQLKNNQKTKKFERNSLRESLKKYAPEKLEKLTKLKDRTDDDIKNVDTCKNLNFSQSLNQDRNLSDGASFLIQKMFSSDKLTKPIQTKSETKSNKLANKTNSKDYYLDTRSCKSSPLKINNYNNFNKSSNFNSTNTDSGVNSSVCADDLENQSINKLNGYSKTDDDDNLSETGTYTVELDNQDPITEEAHKRINDIFGVRETKFKLDDLKLNLDTRSTTSTSSSKPNSKHSFKISTIKPTYQTNNRTRHNSEKNLSATKLNIKKENTLDNELQCKNSVSSSERLSFRNRRSLQNSNLKRQDSFSKSSVSKLSVNNKSINTTTTTTTNKKSQLNQNFNLINQNNTFVFNCNNGSPLLNRARANSISRCLTKNNTSNNIKTNKKIKQNKSNKLNDETNSIKSEEASTNGSGTDLSSINSDKCKSDNGQISSLRFNRAFALRRARLGIDTPPIINNKQNSNNNRNSSKPNSHKPTQTFANHSRSSSQCSATTTATYDHHRPLFDRSDGGRFSLRENSRSTIKAPINKQTKLANNKIIRQESPLINAIKTAKTNIINKMIKNTTTTTTTTKNTVTKTLNKETKILNHVRANSFGGNNIGSNTSLSLNNNETIVLNNSNLKQTSRLSSAASTSSNNTLSNASTSEDLSNISDQLNNVKQLQNLSPFQLGRRIYSTKPHYIAQTNSFRTKLEENSTFVYQNGSFNDLNNQTTNQLNELPTSSLTSNKIETSKKKFGQLSSDSQILTNDLNNQNNSSNVKMLSALDYLVLGAVNQLSFKLRCKLRLILDTEKNKYPIDNDRRIIIEELLPQVNISEYRNSDSVSEKTISRDLSNVLKNLKRIEQSLEVINLLLESNNLTDKKEDNKDAILTNDDNFSLEI